VDNPRAHGPGWREQLDRAAAVCRAGTDPHVIVAIAPQPQGKVGWWIVLPCTYVTRP
jgi:hypothetical protein